MVDIVILGVMFNPVDDGQKIFIDSVLMHFDEGPGWLNHFDSRRRLRVD